MSSKEEILSAIRRHTGTRYEMPDLTLDAITYPDKVAQFSESLQAAGGKIVLLQPGEAVNDVIRQHFPEAKRIASNLPEITCATYNPDDVNHLRHL